MCYNTTTFIGNNVLWTNRIFYDDFSNRDWAKIIQVDTWNNSLFCCSDPDVSPTYNIFDNVIVDEFLTLRVTPEKKERVVAYSSSISTYRDDILYGSFRMSAKMTKIEGTSFGFFFFYSVSEEIDVEVLAHEYNLGRIRTSIQPIIRDKFNRASNVSQRVIDTDKSLSSEFTEYRFDWFKSRVDFFIEGRYYYSLTVNVPSHHGKVVINHRSNGNPRWSRGPPLTTSDVVIRSFDFYFNSSDSSECKSVNYGEYTQKTNDDWKKYTSSIAVGSLFVFVFIIAVTINVYRSRTKNKTQSYSVQNAFSETQQCDIASRRP